MACTAAVPAIPLHREATTGHALLCLEVFASLLPDLPQLHWLLDRRRAHHSVVQVLARAVASCGDSADCRTATAVAGTGPSPAAGIRRVREAAAAPRAAELSGVRRSYRR